jgi:mono/diheme cytochrome c family protein
MLVGKISLLLLVVSIAVGVVSCQKNDSAKPAAGDHHGEHGTPKDWKFTLGKGDAAEGRRLFVEIECYKCHEIKGERFPNVAADEKGIGPELSQMAGMHPIEFFAESIANPDAVIDADAKEQGHVGDDGKSKMPSFAAVLTVTQLADLATYLASLGGGHKH